MSAKPNPRQRAVARITGLVRRLIIGRVPRLFDEAFYRTRYPDVARSGIDPYWHYVRRGAGLGYDPNADFDTAYYRRQSGPTRLDPVRHYLRTGAAAGLDPSPAFSTLMYLARYPDVGRAGINPLLHFRQDGRPEGRIAAPSSTGPDQWVALAGVRAAHRWDYPSAETPRFTLAFRRDIPVEACPNDAPRLCLVLTLDESEMAALVATVEGFAQGIADAVALDIDTTARPHPPRPTAILALEQCFHGTGADGERRLRYAEARLWDLVPERPRVRAIGRGGGLSVGVPAG
ncbi:hypothetical protein [Methylobacterium sp. Leaf112]|uniref:hypothetical protein n=1 Tax=Methylobacterium sp. Leaf112 TaxID=1736258 RepID=UPI0006F8FC34|nr:hypothetical protein [Methylobacterium sp. Leaf112]KQP60863.1 hypothetical protein ASF52_06970 [Methylobacterium sp. Leaf112]